MKKDKLTRRLTPEQRAVAIARRDERLAASRTIRDARIAQEKIAAAAAAVEPPVPTKRPSPKNRKDYLRWKKANANT